MPTCRRKRVMLKELTYSLLEDDPSTPVFYMEQTGEIFSDYESYAARLSFYKLKQFQCEVTGKSGLDYFQALESEQQEAKTLHARFPQPLKAPVLRAVQWQVIGRLDHLVEAVYERFKDRYFASERVYIDVQGDRYWARVIQVYPPRALRARASSTTSDNTTSPPPDAVDEVEPHRISGDLKQPIAQLNAIDDPKSYYYKVQLIEEGTTGDSEYPDAKGKGKASVKYGTSLMEVQSDVMSRDRLSFSKSILRRFIRDCVDRDAAVASPWTVKREIADKYGVENIMPEETRKGVQEVKNKEIEKRKKVWEDKEGPPSKKQRKHEERATSKISKSNDEDIQNKEDVPVQEPEQVIPVAKKRYIKYPTEDLDVILSQRERAKRMAANGHARSVRPTPSTDVPFGSMVFESLLMTWGFFTAFGVPLKLSSFTLDEMEHAIRHSDPEQPVTLIAEIHSSLIYALRALSTHRHLAVLSLLEELDEMDVDGGVPTEVLTDALAETGNNWERQPLRADEGRFGWEEAMVGCIKDQATVAAFPKLRGVLTRLLFALEISEAPAQDPATPGSPASAKASPPRLVRSNPGERYYLLPPEDKIAILAFLCDAVVSHKEIHIYMETCETNLTQLRKEKIEVKKERKKIQEDMIAVAKDDLPAGNGTKELDDSKEFKESHEDEQDHIDVESELSDVESDIMPLSDVEGSDTETVSGAERGRSGSSRQKGLRIKVQGQAHAKQRELARAKTASAKQAQAEHRRLDEEDNKLERRMEGIEREFRKWSGVVRLKPLGKDRFHNRYWWFDGVGGSSLIASGGTVVYGAGRLFIQGPTEADVEIMERKQKDDPSFDLLERRLDQEGLEGMLEVGVWGYFSEPEQFVELMSWLNVKGNRELKLKENLTKWADHISAGMRRRLTDLAINAKLPEARRSTRGKNAPETTRHYEPYLTWQNKKAPSAPS
ncbi:chromatin remodeling complex protein [Ramaria rubella]|nr:chromatin remodeling complex protein [Ramaria rubella]